MIVRRFMAHYGAHPLHLLALLASFALAGYAAVKLFPANPIGIAVWFVGAAVVHDLVLVPLYLVVDQALIGAWRRWHRSSPPLPRAPWINYLRVPLALSALLLVLFLPLVVRLTPNYAGITSLPLAPYLEHWLLITAALFGLSAVGYAVRLRRTRARHQSLSSSATGPTSRAG